MTRNQRISQGFTISELIVVFLVILLIFTIIGLISPALQWSRGANGRQYCGNNLKQLTLSIHAYADSNSDQLPGILRVSPDGTPNGTIVNPFFYALLPGIEQHKYYKAGQTMPATPWAASIDGRTVMQIPMKSLECPGERSNQDGMCNSYNALAGSSYAPNGRMFGTVTKSVGCNIPCLMPFFNINNIPDGTANTIFIEERSPGYKGSAVTSDWCNSWAYPVQMGGTIDPATAPIANSFGSILHPADGSDRAMGPVRLLFENQGESTDTTPPVAALPLFNFNPSGADARRPGSYHYGAILVGMGDGSVRILSPSISPTTWSAAIHPNDGVPLGADW